jgi:hypothetical protein
MRSSLRLFWLKFAPLRFRMFPTPPPGLSFRVVERTRPGVRMGREPGLLNTVGKDDNADNSESIAKQGRYANGAARAAVR